MVIAAVSLAMFGGKRLPELGNGLGEGIRGFTDGLKALTEDFEESTNTAAASKLAAEETARCGKDSG
jgi:sec-independent protein translocase protein TatA